LDSVVLVGRTGAGSPLRVPVANSRHLAGDRGGDGGDQPSISLCPNYEVYVANQVIINECIKKFPSNTCITKYSMVAEFCGAYWAGLGGTGARADWEPCRTANPQRK
jgi:hypothetical protein